MGLSARTLGTLGLVAATAGAADARTPDLVEDPSNPTLTANVDGADLYSAPDGCRTAMVVNSEGATAYTAQLLDAASYVEINGAIWETGYDTKNSDDLVCVGTDDDNALLTDWWNERLLVVDSDQVVDNTLSINDIKQFDPNQGDYSFAGEAGSFDADGSVLMVVEDDDGKSVVGVMSSSQSDLEVTAVDSIYNVAGDALDPDLMFVTDQDTQTIQYATKDGSVRDESGFSGWVQSTTADEDGRVYIQYFPEGSATVEQLVDRSTLPEAGGALESGDYLTFEDGFLLISNTEPEPTASVSGSTVSIQPDEQSQTFATFQEVTSKFVVEDLGNDVAVEVLLPDKDSVATVTVTAIPEGGSASYSSFLPDGEGAVYINVPAEAQLRFLGENCDESETITVEPKNAGEDIALLANCSAGGEDGGSDDGSEGGEDGGSDDGSEGGEGDGSGTGDVDDGNGSGDGEGSVDGGGDDGDKVDDDDDDKKTGGCSSTDTKASISNLGVAAVGTIAATVLGAGRRKEDEEEASE